jgi:hypothetical protein
MCETGDSDLAGRLVTLYAEHQSIEFARIAQAIAGAGETQQSVIRGLLQIAKAEELFADLQTRETAIKVLGILGLAKRRDVHKELYDLFGKTFHEKRLRELAALEALAQSEDRGMPCAEMRLLRTLLRSLLYLREDFGVIAAKQVAEVFRGTRFGRNVDAWIERGS